MPQPSKAERLLARALSKKGIWFKPQITIKIDTRKAGEWKRQIDFMLKRSPRAKQKKLVVEINGTDNHRDVAKKVDSTLKAAGYAVYRVDQDLVLKSPDAIVKAIVNNYAPMRVSEVNKTVQSELRDVRKILKTIRVDEMKAAERAEAAEAGNDVTKTKTASGRR